MNCREKFVEQFGAEQAVKLEVAAESHSNGVNSGRRGSDPFKWVLLICIGYDCAKKQGFREYHGITIPWEELKQWIKDRADLGSHDGDSDYLSLFAGTYNEFMPTKVGQ
jgi:hypothetical protein